MKRRVIVYFLLLIAFVAFVPASKYIWSAKHVVELNNIAEYRIGLAEINDNYFDDFQSRIIVKSKYVIKDNSCLVKASGLNGLNIIQYKNEKDAQEALNYYSSLDYIEYAYTDQKISLDTIDDGVNKDESSSKHLSWGCDLLGIDDYQQFLLSKYSSSNLPDVYVAVLDTGIDTDNEFLKGRIALEYGISYYDSTIPGKYAFEDDNSHGTHVGGTIVDLTLNNVKIIPVKILNNEGSGSISNIISGMEYIISLKNSGLNIVATNMSLGGEVGFTNKEEIVVTNLYDNNIMPVVAAGNSNYYVEEFEPACIDKALTVSALAQNDVYSNFPHISYYSNYGSKIDVCLPGSNILSCVTDQAKYENITISKTGGKYARLNGTSMATPHATAIVALYATYYGTSYDVEMIEKVIKANTYDFGDVGKDDLYGYGVPCLSLAIDNDILSKEPTINYGQLGGEYHFDNSLKVEITNNNNSNKYTHKIYYTLDGSLPTLINHIEYVDGINIDCSTTLRFAIYSFDKDGKIQGDSKPYEVTYFKGSASVNNDGTGFEIDKYGTVKKYTSGIKDIVMPTHINGIYVKKLATNLFCGQNITSFVCEHDCEIGYYPFVSCGELKSITLHSTNCKNLSDACFGLQELILPNITHIEGAILFSVALNITAGNYTFRRCFNLKKIVAPKINIVEESSFSGQKKLESLDIDWQNIKSIGEYAFNDCASLQYDIVLPSSFTTIAQSAFYGSGIKSVYAPSVTTIEMSAFGFCENLQRVTFGNLISIGKRAFSFCKNLTGNIQFANGATIDDKAFTYCESLSEPTLPSNLTIGDYAFQNCNFTHIKIPACNMGKYVFNGCRQLKEVELDSAISSLPEGTFKDCNRLEKIDFSKIKSIGANALLGCSSLISVDLSYCTELLTDENGLGNNFGNCYNLEEVILSENLSTIPNEAFINCFPLKSINLNNVKIFGDNAFGGCYSMQELNLSSAEIIGKTAFRSVKENTKIILNDNENIIANNENSGIPNVYDIYISKNYTGPIGNYIKNTYVNKYDNISNEYILYSKYRRVNAIFKLKDGTIVGSELISSKDIVKFPSQFENDDKIVKILCWQINGQGSNIYSYPYTYITEDTIFIAGYTIEEYKKYQINFYYNYDFDMSGTINDDGDIFKQVKIEKTKKITITEAPQKEATAQYEYVFVGWECNGILYNVSNLPVVEGNMNLYAKFQSITRKYKISWYGLDKKIIYSEYLEYGATPKFKNNRIFTVFKISLFNYRSWLFVIFYRHITWSPNISKVTGNCNYYAVLHHKW